MNETRMWKRVSLILLAVLAVCAVVVIGIVTMVLRHNDAAANDTADSAVVAEASQEQSADETESAATAEGSAAVEAVMEQEQEAAVPGQSQTIYSSGGSAGEMLEINTKYCTILYPAEWSGNLVVQETQLDEGDVVTFFCSLDGQDVVLYNVYFNCLDMGDMIGYITVDGEKVSCSVEYSDYVPEDWDEEKTDLFFGMAECINDVLDSIKSNETFTEQ